MLSFLTCLSVFAAGAALGLIVGFAGNAKADGFYVEIRQWLWTEARFRRRLRKGSFYIQGGPTVATMEPVIGALPKTGVSAAVAEKTTCMARFQLALSMTCPTSKPV